MTPETRIARARELRGRQTRAEAVLWQYLRASRLDGLRFRRQHPVDRYFVDFACLSLKIIIELDGGIHDEDGQQLQTLAIDLAPVNQLITDIVRANAG